MKEFLGAQGAAVLWVFVPLCLGALVVMRSQLRGHRGFIPKRDAKTEMAALIDAGKKPKYTLMQSAAICKGWQDGDLHIVNLPSGKRTYVYAYHN